MLNIVVSCSQIYFVDINLAREVSIAIFPFGVVLSKAKAKLHKEAEDKIKEVPCDDAPQNTEL